MQQFEGGQSNPTFALRAGSREYVLRKQPPGELLPSAHQVDREYRVMHALRDSDVPVPKMYALCEDTSVIGTKFYVMEKVEGRVFTDLLLPSMNNAERRAVYKDLARVLAALHAVDHRAVGLESFGKPGNYYTRQISRWSKQYVASQTESAASDGQPDAVAARTHAASRRNRDRPRRLPDGQRADPSRPSRASPRCSIGNCPRSGIRSRISATCAWTITRIRTRRAGLARPDLADFGIPSEREFIADYCAFAGRGAIDNWNFYVDLQPVPLGRDHSRRLQARPRRQREFRYRDRLQRCVPDARGSRVGLVEHRVRAALTLLVR